MKYSVPEHAFEYFISCSKRLEMLNEVDCSCGRFRVMLSYSTVIGSLSHSWKLISVSTCKCLFVALSVSVTKYME